MKSILTPFDEMELRSYSDCKSDSAEKKKIMK